MPRPTEYAAVPELLAVLLGPSLPVRPACAGLAPAFDEALDDEDQAQREARHHRAVACCRRCPALDACRAAASDLDGATSGILAGELYRYPTPAEQAEQAERRRAGAER